ncbi:hypothetical protein J6590_029238 [Homalodisca vitripennis]|nr:hypothetical protein J6590_029238 [Homalodisca vitripennis]
MPLNSISNAHIQPVGKWTLWSRPYNALRSRSSGRSACALLCVFQLLAICATRAGPTKHQINKAVFPSNSRTYLPGNNSRGARLCWVRVCTGPIINFMVRYRAYVSCVISVMSCLFCSVLLIRLARRRGGARWIASEGKGEGLFGQDIAERLGRAVRGWAPRAYNVFNITSIAPGILQSHGTIKTTWRNPPGDPPPPTSPPPPQRKCEVREAEVLEPKDLTSRAMFPATQIKMSTSPATSPTMSNSSSPTPTPPSHPQLNYNHKITGIPCVAAASRYTAPVHIDVGGTIYTSSLETLTKGQIVSYAVSIPRLNYPDAFILLDTSNPISFEAILLKSKVGQSGTIVQTRS